MRFLFEARSPTRSTEERAIAGPRYVPAIGTAGGAT
jgi:hypothetical protein